MKKGGTGRCCGLGLDVGRGGAWTTRRCDNLRGRLVGEGAGPNGTTNLERGVLEKGTGLSLYYACALWISGKGRVVKGQLGDEPAAECACARWTSKKGLLLGKRAGLRWALQRMRMRTVDLRLGGGVHWEKGRGPQSCRAGTSSWSRGGYGCRELRSRRSGLLNLRTESLGGGGKVWDWDPREGGYQPPGRAGERTLSELAS